jgi:hypothetical protein
VLDEDNINFEHLLCVKLEAYTWGPWYLVCTRQWIGHELNKCTMSPNTDFLLPCLQYEGCSFTEACLLFQSQRLLPTDFSICYTGYCRDFGWVSDQPDSRVLRAEKPAIPVFAGAGAGVGSRFWARESGQESGSARKFRQHKRRHSPAFPHSKTAAESCFYCVSIYGQPQIPPQIHIVYIEMCA